MKNWKGIAMLAVALLLAQFALTNWFYPAVLHSATQQLFAIQPATGIGGQTVGMSILKYVSGFVPPSFTNFMSWISMFIGAFLLVTAGVFLYEQNGIPLWKGRNQYQRLFAILLYGHIVLYGVLWLMLQNVPGITLPLLVGVALNLAFVSLLVTASAKYLNFPRY